MQRTTPNRKLPEGKKYFDLDEANRSLIYVSRVVSSVIKGFEELKIARRNIEKAKTFRETLELEEVYQDKEENLQRYIREVKDSRVVIRDIVTGLIDFPAIYQGREIYLCWQYGESRIEHWHEISHGFNGRRPVSELNR